MFTQVKPRLSFLRHPNQIEPCLHNVHWNLTFGDLAGPILKSAAGFEIATIATEYATKLFTLIANWWATLQLLGSLLASWQFWITVTVHNFRPCKYALIGWMTQYLLLHLLPASLKVLQHVTLLLQIFNSLQWGHFEPSISTWLSWAISSKHKVHGKPRREGCWGGSGGGKEVSISSSQPEHVTWAGREGGGGVGVVRGWGFNSKPWYNGFFYPQKTDSTEKLHNHKVVQHSTSTSVSSPAGLNACSSVWPVLIGVCNM